MSDLQTPHDKARPETAEALRCLQSRAWSSHDPELWQNLAQAYLQQGWLPEAEAAWRRTLHLHPGHEEAIRQRTEFLLQQGLPYSAMHGLQTASAAGAPDAIWRPRLEELHAQYPVRRVTVYVPACAAEEYLERCLRSIRAQTYPIHVVLVVDDGSPDRSAAIALGQGAHVLRHDQNRGLAAACNTALEHCTADFLAKIDSDLELHPTWLERAMLAFHDERTAGVGGRLLEHRTATIPDQWRRVFLAQHWGPDWLDDAPGLFGADCVFRVEALKAVGGWNLRYRTNFEDMDLSLRLKTAGWRLVYEPRAWARHLRQDSLHGVLRNFWNWYHPPQEDRGAYESLTHATACLGVNRNLALERINNALSQGWVELLYPTYLLYYVSSVRDLQHVLRRGKAGPEAASQTGLGLYRIVRRQLRECPHISGRVAERTLRDVRVCLRTLLSDADWGNLDQEESPEHLPAAETTYLDAFARQSYLSMFGPSQGPLLDLALQVLEKDEEEYEARSTHPPCWVIFNPPGGPEDRWLIPSRIEALADCLESSGLPTCILDSAARQLSEREAFERVTGLEPAGVVFSAAEGGLERLAASARRLKLVEGIAARLVLVGVENVSQEDLPMFDEVHAGTPSHFPPVLPVRAVMPGPPPP